MADIDKLRSDYEKAEAKLIKLGGEYDDAKAKLKEKYQGKLAEASQDAADAQKALCDAEAAAALVGRDDAEIVANNLGLTLPD